MKIVIPKETKKGESRIAMLPSIVEKLKRIGADIVIEKGLGEPLSFSDADFEKAGAYIQENRSELLKNADVVLKVHPLSVEEITLLKKKCIHISFFDAFQQSDIKKAFLEQGVSSFSMEMIPRTTLAQKMDALSSQASLAGYAAIISAAERINKILPMVTTPAGTIFPLNVFVIGVGVAGLQAIATAKRLGAKVYAFDTRPVVEEQVKSLGAKFVKVDLGEMSQTKQGYAKALSEEQMQMQREAMERVCIQSDIVVTTAQLVGKKAPLIITKQMIEKMKPGTVIVDMAASSGGNVEGTIIDTVVDHKGVQIVGFSNFPGKVAYHASQMYASNLFHFVHHFWDQEKKIFFLDFESEISKNCLITYEHALQNEIIKTASVTKKES